jgi:hypothetical protein
MAHPNLLASDEAFEQSIGMLEVELREAVLASFALLYATAQDVGHELLPVTDTEYGNTAVK